MLMHTFVTTDRFWQTARGNGAGVVAALLLTLLCHASAARAQTNGARSTVHPAAMSGDVAEWYAGKSDNSNPGFGGGEAAPPLALAASGPNETLFSANVNVVTCRAAGGAGEVWLGTNLGIKRIEPGRGGKPATVRHFTRGDGLPGDRILALAADANGASAWCLVSLAGPPPLFSAWNETPGAVALCCWERRTGRWETLRRVALTPTFGSEPSWPFPRGPLAQPAAIVLSPDYVGFVLPRPTARVPGRAATDAAKAAADFALLLWNRRARRWRDVPWNSEMLDAAKSVPSEDDRWSQAPPPAIRFVWAETSAPHNLWLGTSAGLLRYNLPDRHWQRFLLGHAVCAGRVRNGVFYLANLVAPPTPVPPAPRPAATGRFVRFSSQTSQVVTEGAWPAPALSETFPDNSGGFGVFDAPCALGLAGDGAVWIAVPVRRLNNSGYDRNATLPPAAFLRRNPQTGKWSRRLAWRTDDFDNAPDAVLFDLLPSPLVPAVALTPPRPAAPSPLAVALARRFPAWLCPPADLPPEVSPPLYEDPYRVIEDGARIEWQVRIDNNETVLVRREKAANKTAPAGVRETVFPLPPPGPVAVLPPLRALAVAGDTIFAAQVESLWALWAYDTVSLSWRRVNLPPGS